MAIYVDGKEVGVIVDKDLSDATATANDILKGKTAYTSDGKVTGTYEEWQPNPDWYDIQKILDESEDIEGYPYKGVALFTNIAASSIGFYNSDNQNLIIKTSDGDTSEATTKSPYASVTFTGVNDKPCYIDGVEVYKTRYCIVYSTNENWRYILGVGRGGNGLLWVVYNQDIMPISEPNGRLNDYIVLEKIPPVLKNLSSVGVAITSYSLRTKVSFPENVPHSTFDFISDETLYIDASSFTTMTNYYRNIYEKHNIRKLVFSNTSHIETFNTCFYYSFGLKVIEGLDLLSASSVTSIFSDCYHVTILDIKNIKISIAISDTGANVDSLINIIKELWDYSDGEATYTLTMGSAKLGKIADVYVKLVDITDEMRVEDEYIDNKKPFEVCESTDEGAMTISDYVYSKNWALA